MSDYYAPGKLLLFGEHAAVFGYPAVGMTLPMGLSIDVEPSDQFEVQIADGTRPYGGQPVGLTRFAAFLATVLIDFQPVRITVTSKLPISSGFGSSAALCTAIAQWALGDVAPDTLWRLAHRLEHFFHGTPSGIDTGLTCIGGVGSFEFSDSSPLPDFHALTPNLPPLVVGSLPREQSTKELVAHIGNGVASGSSSVRSGLQALGAIATKAIAYLVPTSVQAVGLAVMANQAHERLRELGVSTPLMDEVITTGRAAGALGGKLSGAGGGGAFYLVCDKRSTANTVLSAVRKVLPQDSPAFVIKS